MSLYSIVNHKLTLILVTILVIVMIFSLRKTAQKAVVSNRVIQNATQVNDQLQADLATAKNQEALSKHPFTQERILRDEQLMQKPGEKIIQIPNEDLNIASQSAAPSPSIWQEWWKLIN